MSKNRGKILIVDDDEGNLIALQAILQQEAFLVVPARNASSALSLIKRDQFDLVISDLRMPGISGLELLRSIRTQGYHMPVIMLTAFATVSDAVEAMKLGAIDFLSKPVRRETLLKIVTESLTRKNTGHETTRIHLIGKSHSISEIKRTIKLLAKTNASVLIEGESGTGKDIVAQLIHMESARRGSLVTLNCGAIPESLLESELFGYEKGAFTGATSWKLGHFEAADNGTLFLDEIGEMPLSLQVKLLRVLQDGTFYRLGSTEAKRADVRIVAATNSNLKERIESGSFREDLFYRLNVVSLQMPPLRDRAEDISLLTQFFLDDARIKFAREDVILSDDALQALSAHTWPGNIRELKNVIERTFVLMEGTVILPSHLKLSHSPKQLEVKAAADDDAFSFKVGTKLHDMELLAIKKTLEFTNGDKVKAAELLGINLRTIYRKLSELNLEE